MNFDRQFNVLATAIALSLVATGAQAAGKIDLQQRNIAKLKQQYQSVAATRGVAAMAHTRHEQFIGTDANSRLLMKATSEDHGVRNFRYDQTFRGIPVFGEGIVVSETSAGNIRKLFGNLVSGLEQDIASTTPRITRGTALATGKQGRLGSRISAYRTENEKSELVVFVDDNGRGHLAYAVSFFADGANVPPTRPMILIDANNGRVLKQWENLQHALVGTGPGGNSKTGQYEWGSGGIYAYMDVSQSGSTCTMNNTNVKSVNLNGSTGTSTTAFSYTCPRNTVKAINGAYAPINDAHSFGAVITKMYPAYTGYNALSFQLVMRVHYGSNYENAFWNGSNMSFGDGASTFYPLVNADVSGHEVSHGFTEQHSNLTYSGMSGGMNEAFSDMGGEATEHYWKGSNDFDVGREIFKSGSGALRYMCNPTADGSSIDNAANFTSSMDVHNSSGVYNKAFCTLAKTSGWSTPTAFKVFARANALYWTASSTFNQGACGVETAAGDLGLTVASVTAAFSGVGVSCATTPPPTGGGALTNGVAKTGQSGAAGSSLSYTMVVPAGATGLKFVTSGGTGDADLYAKFGSAPTTTVNDCKSEGSTTAETCTIATAQAGTYYVLVKGYTAFSGMSITGSYTAGGGGGGSCGGLVLCDNVGVALPSVATSSFSSDYTMPIAAGHTVTFTISGGTGDADMYVRAGTAPTTTTYNCRPYASGNSETCTFTPTTATTYHVKVRAYAAFSGVTLKGDTN
ncbi:MAG: M4 family metallopeptidase [Thermomonas sp.]